MSAAPQKRRTQAERKAAMVERLLDGTIVALAEVGYAKTSVAEICRRAEASQGALFRHFPTRLDVIVAATQEIESRHLSHLAELFGERGWDGDMLQFVRWVRSTSRTLAHAAWHEVMVAARTDLELRKQVQPVLAHFEAQLLEAAAAFFGVTGADAERLGVVFLSVMHMFDSEAVTIQVQPNAQIEAAREQWAAELLTREVGG